MVLESPPPRPGPSPKIKPPPPSENDFIGLSPAEIRMLTLIAEGRGPKNSAVIIAALKLKAEYTLKKPQGDDARVAPVTVVINSMGPEPVATVEAPLGTPSAEDEENIQ